ncbi:choice-of-anchor D domain-containing protein [Aureibaculum conchae]|uniref:choice-of-anchor D domain-containing protein n=1 Tax=Aureibaculum sp. 2308TA14-22 TaxID=3108392 RepID=UPI003392120A
MMKKLLCTLLFAVIAIGTISAQGTISGGSPALPITTTTALPTANTPLPAQGTDFGTVAISGTQQNTFIFTSTVGGTQFLALQNITGANASEFSASFSPGPSTVNGIGATSSFVVNFNPITSGPKTAIVEFRSAPSPFGPTTSYFFEIIGTGGAASPSIKVTGDDSLEIINGSTNPSPGDNTHFGTAVANVESVTRQFTIENDGTADLIIDNISSGFGSTDFSVSLGAITFPLTIPAGNSVTFNVVFAPTSPASPPPIDIASFILIDAADDTYDFFYEVEGVGTPAEPDMEVSGLGQPITDGSAASLTNGTDFGDVDINTVGGFSRTFTIENTGTDDLVLTSLAPIVNITGADAADFTVTANPTTPIAPNATTTFTVRFDPSTVGIKVAEISISNNTTNGKNPYNFDITGNATDVATSGQLLITQYYEGTGANDQWIEVKNISALPVTGGVYYLCLYTDTNATIDGNIETLPPQQFIPIDAMTSGQVRLYRNPSATLPANLGGAIVQPTNVCTFTGNDVILISTSTGGNCYNERIDIMGMVPSGGTPQAWGQDKAFIKGCGTTELPTRTFDVTIGGVGGLLVNDYLELSLAEVNNADSQSNMALGTQESGTTTWTTSWSNGVPDKTRVVVVSGIYTNTGSNGSISACDLTVTGTLNMDNGTTDYVEVNRSFTNTGTVVIGDQESLYTVNTLDPDNFGGDAVTISGTITKLETTTSLNNVQDYTYWSSPVAGQNISSVFAPGVYNQDRLYYWNQAADNDIPNGGSEAKGEWIAAAGEIMIPGKGYISQGPVAGSYPGTATISFTGVPNTTTVDLIGSPHIHYNPNANIFDDLNLVGNPYPSAINADKFILNSNNIASVTGSLWFWSHRTPNNGSTTGEQYTSDDYALYNLSGGVGTPSPSGANAPTNIIASGQGFMIQTRPSASIITFTDDMRERTQAGTQVFRGTDTKSTKATEDEKDRVWLNAMSSKGGAASQILVAFIPTATDGVDWGYDGVKISQGWVNLYSKIDTLKYGIQALGNFDLDKKVPLVFQTYIEETDVNYTISIDRFEGVLRDNDIYLVDHELNVTHDLKQGDYMFTVPSDGEYGERFTLQFTKSTLGVDDLELHNDFVIVNENNALLVKSKSIISELKMYDITGRMLVNMLPNESEFRINTQNIRKGTVLILNTTFENGTELSKKAIKY